MKRILSTLWSAIGSFSFFIIVVYVLYTADMDRLAFILIGIRIAGNLENLKGE